MYLKFPLSWAHCERKWANLKFVVILNLIAVSGICLITLSGITPFNFSNFKTPTVITGCVVELPNNLTHVASPTTPSEVKPFFFCQSLTDFPY